MEEGGALYDTNLGGNFNESEIWGAGLTIQHWETSGRNPYNDGQKDNQVLVAINAYLQF
jgi:hypothetical protein